MSISQYLIFLTFTEYGHTHEHSNTDLFDTSLSTQYSYILSNRPASESTAKAPLSADKVLYLHTEQVQALKLTAPRGTSAAL